MENRKMKPSGIKWIGDIPFDWKVLRVKDGFVQKKSKAFQIDPVVLTLARSGVKIRDMSNAEGQFAASYYEYNPVDIDDMLINPMDLISGDNCSLSKVEGVISPAYVNLRYKKGFCPSYYQYYFKYQYWSMAFFAHGKGVSFENRWTLNNETLMKFPLVTPPFDVQKLVADFLDQKCGEIDTLVSDIQSQIETLENYKKSIITEAVTRGLNPNAEIIGSRIFYMAPYNASWRLTKIGYECTKLWRSFKAEDSPLLCTNKGKVAVRPPEMAGKMVSEDNAMQGIRKGDIAIHGMDTWHGAIALSEYDGKITRVVHVCDSTQEKRFIVYYLQQLAFNGVYKLISNGVRGNTSDFRSWDKVKNIYIALPDINEQIEIADYLDEKCAEIEAIIADKKAQLETLADYKKSLIYEYVTGKKQVKENA